MLLRHTWGDNMSYEIKVILKSLADMALLTKSKTMYRLISNMANVEGVVLKPYDEAIKELENE